MTRVWIREPKQDKRFKHGDDWAGDAWRNSNTDEVRWTAVGYDMNIVEARYDAARETQ